MIPKDPANIPWFYAVYGDSCFPLVIDELVTGSQDIIDPSDDQQKHCINLCPASYQMKAPSIYPSAVFHLPRQDRPLIPFRTLVTSAESRNTIA